MLSSSIFLPRSLARLCMYHVYEGSGGCSKKAQVAYKMYVSHQVWRSKRMMVRQAELSMGFSVLGS
jgi:hypothetical protein